MRSRALVATAVLTLCGILVGCTGAEAVAVIGAIGGAYLGLKKIQAPVAGAIAADPGAFWSTLGQVIGLLTLIVTVAAKAGKDHKRKER